jgi:hypothetical protein
LPLRFACLSHLISCSCLLLVLLVKFGLWSENPHTVTVVTCLRDRKEKNGIEKKWCKRSESEEASRARGQKKRLPVNWLNTVKTQNLAILNINNCGPEKFFLIFSIKLFSIIKWRVEHESDLHLSILYHISK